MPSSITTHLSPTELSYLHTSLSSHPPIRPDARLTTDFRPFHAELGVLPNTMGSAHVGFADGREAVVGVRAEVERTTRPPKPQTQQPQVPSTRNTTKKSKGKQSVGEDVQMSGTQPATGDATENEDKARQGNSEWISLSLSLPSSGAGGSRDDDKDLIFLEEMLREILVIPTATAGTPQHSETVTLQDSLVINHSWHWHLYVDVLLISQPESTSGNYPLPLLSVAIHLALRDTRIPRLKSEGDEDPVADDDWDDSRFLYNRTQKQIQIQESEDSRVGVEPALLPVGILPPVTLLVMAVGENVIFDPSPSELMVSDAVFAVSVASTNKSGILDKKAPGGPVQLIGIRMLETAARDTMKGMPRLEEGHNPWDVIPGVWRPKVGGIKRGVVSKVLKVVNDEVARDVIQGLQGFVDGGVS